MCQFTNLWCSSCPLPQSAPHILASRSYTTPSKDRRIVFAQAAHSALNAVPGRVPARRDCPPRLMHMGTAVRGVGCTGRECKGGEPRGPMHQSGPGTVGTCLSYPVFRQRSRSCRGHLERSSSTFGETTGLEQPLRPETRQIKYPERPPRRPSSCRGDPLTSHGLKPQDRKAVATVYPGQRVPSPQQRAEVRRMGPTGEGQRKDTQRTRPLPTFLWQMSASVLEDRAHV